MIATLGHKYGHSVEDAKAAVAKYKADIERLKGENKLVADLRPGITMTPVMAGAIMLARLHDIRAAKALMARSTPVSREAEKGLRDILHLAQMHGYHTKTTQNRAFYTVEMSRDDIVLHLMGWHGTGRFAGGEKAVLELYDNRHGDKPVVSIGALTEDNLTVENEKRVVQKIVEYIKKQA